MHFPSGRCIFRRDGAFSVGMVHFPLGWCIFHREGTFSVRIAHSPRRAVHIPVLVALRAWWSYFVFVYQNHVKEIMVGNSFDGQAKHNIYIYIYIIHIKQKNANAI